MSAKNDVSEGEAFIGRKDAKKSKFSGFMEFLYNKQTGKVLGRTCSSWAEISAFYFVFYACLAGFFVACVAVFLQTLDDTHPRYYGKGSIIGANPGVGYQPWLRDDPESTLIKFDKDDKGSYEKYTKKLTEIADQYKDEDMKGCPSGKSEKDASCKVDIGAIQKFCGQEDWGFGENEPCVLLTLNKLLGWSPEEYTDEDPKPEELKDENYKAGDVALQCAGEYDTDKDNLAGAEIVYSPQTGLDGKFFPYFNTGHYQKPIVAVKFRNIKPGVIIMVECRAYAKNIVQDRQEKLGMVRFELFRTA